MMLDHRRSIYSAVAHLRTIAPRNTAIAAVTIKPGEKGTAIALCRFTDGSTRSVAFVPPCKPRAGALPDLAEAQRQFTGIVAFLGRNQ